MPKPAHKPTSESRELVGRLASIGIPQDKIADVIGVSAPTLRAHYRAELDGAALRANAAVAGNLFKMATGDGPRAVTAAIFWMKTRGGWKENDISQQDPTELAREIQRSLIEARRLSSGIPPEATTVESAHMSVPADETSKPVEH